MDQAHVASEPTLEFLPLTELHESPLNPRKTFDEAAMAELTANVQARGIISPLLVRPREVGGYEIYAGHRRYRAATRAELLVVPCIVRELSDADFLEQLTLENLHREDLRELEEAEGYKTLMESGGYDVAIIAAKVGKSPSYVYQRLKLTELVVPAKEALLAETISAGHAILLARLQPDQQEEALAWATATQRGDEPASVRALNQHIQEDVLLDLTKAPFDTSDATLVVKAGACGVCPFRAGNQATLFPDIAKGDTCTAPTCYQAKVAAHLERIADGVQADTGKKPVRISLAAQPQHGEKKLPGVVYRGWNHPLAYRLIDADGCPHAQQAVVFHRDLYYYGDNRIPLGAVVTICRDPKCRKGEPQRERHANAAPKPKPKTAAERKRDRDQHDKYELTRRTHEIQRVAIVDRAVVIGRAVEPLDENAGPDWVALLRIVARGIMREIWPENLERIARRRGWLPVEDGTKKKGLPPPNYVERESHKALENLSPHDIVGLCAELALARSGEPGTYQPELDKPLRLDVVAGVLSVDISVAKKAAAAEVRADRKAWDAEEAKRIAREKAKKKAKPKASTKAKATKAPAAAPPPDEDDELDLGPACEACACVEDNACPDGCAWDPAYEATGRWVCTTDSCGQDIAKRDAKLAKQHKRPYAGPESVADLHTSATA